MAEHRLPKPCVGCSVVAGGQHGLVLGALPLGAAEQAGEQRVDQVGAADGAVQEAAAAEEGRAFEVAVPDDVRLVVQRVPRGVEDLDLEGADRDDVPALDRQPVDLDPLLGRQQVRHPVARGQQAAPER